MPDKLGFKMREQYVRMVETKFDQLIQEEASLLEATKIQLEQHVKEKLGITAMEEEINDLQEQKAKLEDQICEIEDNVARIQGKGKRERKDSNWRKEVGENILALELENALKHSKAYTRKGQLERQKAEMLQKLWLLGSEEEVKEIFSSLEEITNKANLMPVRHLEILPEAV